MKAVIRTQYGDAKVLQVTTLERPVPQKHEVLVRVRAAGLDYGQWHLMTGEPYVMRLATGLTKPKQPVLGADVSGVVEAVGAEVTRFKVGDAVFGASSRTFAEFACAREDQLCLKPERLSFEQAAASAISGVTALIGLRDLAKVKPGQSVCVIGAGGGVGSWAVQLARHFGGRVTAVCSTSKVEFVHALGAAAVKCSKHSVHNVVNMPHQVGSRRAGQSGGYAACRIKYASQCGSCAGFGGRSGVGSSRGRSSLLMSCTRTWASRCAPSSDQRICWLLAMRRLTTWLTADSAMLLLTGRPLWCRLA